MAQTPFPPLSLADWRPTRDTIAGYTQVAGKVRRSLTPPQKHWWHVSLRVAAMGLTTTPIPGGKFTFEIVLDFKQHQLRIFTSHGHERSVPFQGQSAAAVYAETLSALADLGIKADIDRAPFANDRPGTYDEAAVARFWQALTQIDILLKEFKAGLRQESSPVQLWPHHFDLAVLWFSGRLVPGQDPNDPDYADEQMNFGFSTGDSAIPDPYFYATAYPRPEGFTDQPLPADAYWHTEGFTGAVMLYEALVAADKPKEKLLNFLRAAHQAGSSLMLDAG